MARGKAGARPTPARSYPGKATPTKSRAEAKRPSPSTLLESTDATVSPAKVELKRQSSLHGVVMKTFHDNFKGWEESALHAVVVDGMDLHARLEHDKQEGVPTGKHHYKDLRAKYQLDDSLHAQLVAKIAADMPDERLQQALKEHRRGSSAYLEAWFDDDTLPNQLNFVAILHFIVDVPLTAGWKQMAIAMKAMTWVARVQGDTTYAEDFFVVKNHVDKLLYRSWQLYKASGTSTKDWWTLVKGWAKAVLSCEAFERLVNVSQEEHKDWTGLLPDLCGSCARRARTSSGSLQPYTTPPRHVAATPPRVLPTRARTGPSPRTEVPETFRARVPTDLCLPLPPQLPLPLLLPLLPLPLRVPLPPPLRPLALPLEDRTKQAWRGVRMCI